MNTFMTVTNKVVSKTLDIGQRLFSLFVIWRGSHVVSLTVIGVSVAKSALIAGFMAVAGVLQKLAAASTDGELTAEEIAEAFKK